ncbi:MAG: hypothetical protein K0Q60_2051 [Microvirga sp.]|jgi:hypothetical protein|nr:hypothetical protein [Microvirga sp.]
MLLCRVVTRLMQAGLRLSPPAISDRISGSIPASGSGPACTVPESVFGLALSNPARLHEPQAVARLARSSFKPGPIVEVTDTFLM